MVTSIDWHLFASIWFLLLGVQFLTLAGLFWFTLYWWDNN